MQITSRDPLSLSAHPRSFQPSVGWAFFLWWTVRHALIKLEAHVLALIGTYTH